MVDFTLGTAVSSRIRLARNLNGYPFPARLKSDRQAKEIIRAVSAALNKVDEFKLYYMDGISEDEALNFVENRLISPALLNTPSRSAALINEKRTTCANSAYHRVCRSVRRISRSPQRIPSLPVQYPLRTTNSSATLPPAQPIWARV